MFAGNSQTFYCPACQMFLNQPDLGRVLTGGLRVCSVGRLARLGKVICVCIINGEVGIILVSRHRPNLGKNCIFLFSASTL